MMNTAEPPLPNEQVPDGRHSLYSSIPAAYRDGNTLLPTLCTIVDTMLQQQWDAVDKPGTVFSPRIRKSQWLAHFAQAPSPAGSDIEAAESTFRSWGTQPGLYAFMKQYDSEQSLITVAGNNAAEITWGVDKCTITTKKPVRDSEWVTRHLIPAHLTTTWKAQET